MNQNFNDPAELKFLGKKTETRSAFNSKQGAYKYNNVYK